MRPGEVRQCNGCHDPSAPGVSHGRTDSFAPVNTGAGFPGDVFPGTDFAGSINTGDTMAAARARYCSLPTSGCNSLELSLELVYEDVWSEASLTPDPAVRSTLGYDGLDGVDGLLTDFPEYDAAKCLPWTVGCRVIINYRDHIQPLWDEPRLAIETDTLGTANSCVSCHALLNNGVLIDPDSRGQLELTSNPSDQDATQFKSYRELLSGDTQEALDGGAVTIVTQPRLDAMGNPVLDANGDPIEDPVAVASPLSIAGAAARPLFFQRFVSDMGTVSHNGWLSDAELLLLAEWLDMGAQYFNDPFHIDVPLN